MVSNEGCERVCYFLYYWDANQFHLFASLDMVTVSLEGNKIGDEGAEKLGEMLSENNGLTWVTLDRNKVSNEGAGHLRKGLKRNKTMKSIYVLKNKLKEDEKKRMEALLGKHASLEQVGV
eukprot:m.26161 g.26161  ORF g.26161 m.26161 type:complete len:120 (+) comp5830_c0_seq3:102-461(+)